MPTTRNRLVAPPVRRPKNRKDQIALAAAELFCERGYHGASVDEIAALVGIKGPAVYRHFPNKYAILVHATRRVVDALLAATDVPSRAQARDRLDLLLGAMATVAVDMRRVGGLYQWEGRYLSPEHRREFALDLAKLVRRTARPLQVLRDDVSKEQAELLVNAVLSVYASLATHRTAAAGIQTEALLIRVAWALLTTDPPRLPAARRPPRVGTPVRPSSRRELLLAEAIPLFHRHGFHAVSMEDIGSAAGIQASSVYRYFPSKAELLAAAYYRAADRLTGATSAAIGAAADPPDALRRVVAAYVAYAFGQSDLVAVYLAENNSLPEDDRHELRKVQRDHVEEWVRLVRDVRPDVPAADARILVHAALNVITDIGRLGHFDESSGFDAQTIELAVAVLYA